MKNDPANPHAPLECPVCGKVCKPRRETRDGGATYICTNTNGHPNFENLNFTIDDVGELRF